MADVIDLSTERARRELDDEIKKLERIKEDVEDELAHAYALRTREYPTN